MRSRFGFLVAVMAAVAALALPAEARPSAAQDGPIRVLFLIGGASHDWEGMSAVLVRILEASGDFRVTLTQDRDWLAPERVKDFDTLIFFTQGGELTGPQRAGLLGFVKRGGGFVGLHSATATFKTSDDYWELVGGRFTTHSFREFEVKCEAPSHPVTRVFSSFRVTDEDYHHSFKPGVALRVLATREGDPAIWTRQYGKGRVIVNTLGHDARAWNSRVVQTLAFRSVYWAAGREPKPMPAGLFRAEGEETGEMTGGRPVAARLGGRTRLRSGMLRPVVPENSEPKHRQPLACRVCFGPSFQRTPNRSTVKQRLRPKPPQPVTHRRSRGGGESLLIARFGGHELARPGVQVSHAVLSAVLEGRPDEEVVRALLERNAVIPVRGQCGSGRVLLRLC